MNVSKWAPGALLAAGIIAAGYGILLGAQRYGPRGRYSLSQVNGLCSSPAGQLAQALNSRASVNCATVAGTEQWHGWLIITGVAAVLIAAGWAVYAFRARPNVATAW